jgi:hypothetical protein
MLVINAPGLATMGWRMVKGWLDPRTKKKIEIVGKADSLKRLKELVPLDQVCLRART